MSQVPAPAVAWAEQACGAGVTGVEELRGGISSEIYRLRLGSGRDVVLRRMTQPAWRALAGELLPREFDVLGRLAATAVATPEPLALDADGALSGEPSLLMTHLPGELGLARWNGGRLTALAACLVAVHRSLPAPIDDEYASWAAEKPIVPEWSADDGLYREAHARVAEGPPDFEPSFLHRDFHLGNVLWHHDTVSGVVDWGFACSGPVELDVAHCGSNLASLFGAEAAEPFAREYVEQGGVLSEDSGSWQYWRLVDLLGFLPGRAGDAQMAREWTSLGVPLDEATVRRRREDLLRLVLAS